MARKQVVEIRCSRCERTETVEPTIMMEGKTHVMFTASLIVDPATETTKQVQFEDLCGPCRRTVFSLLEQVDKRIEGVSPDRVPGARKKKAGEEQPHNGAAPHPLTPQTAASKKPAARASS
jgi:hypothetical protein